MTSAKRYKIEASGLGAAAKMEVEVGTINTDLGWFKFKERLWAKFEATFRILDVPLVYTIALTKPAGWTMAQATSDLEKLIYSVALTGAVFKKDNESAWQIIQAATIGTQSYEWIQSFGDNSNV